MFGAPAGVSASWTVSGSSACGKSGGSPSSRDDLPYFSTVAAKRLSSNIIRRHAVLDGLSSPSPLDLLADLSMENRLRSTAGAAAGGRRSTTAGRNKGLMPVEKKSLTHCTVEMVHTAVPPTNSNGPHAYGEC